MSTQNLIIYKFIPLYHILEELDLDLNFKVSVEDNERSLQDKVKNYSNCLIISNKKYLDFDNQFILEKPPIKIFKLIEKILSIRKNTIIKINNEDYDYAKNNLLGKNISYKLNGVGLNKISRKKRINYKKKHFNYRYSFPYIY